jgi:preprotein translocase subunit YajC
MGAAIFIVVVFGLLFAMLIIPRQREVRRHNELISSLQVGDEVMIGSGIYGTIRELDADYAHLEIAPGTTVKVARRGIAARVDETAAPAEDDSDDVDVDVEGDAADLGPAHDDADAVDHDTEGSEA